jgi:hypothetical protein
MHFPLPMRSIRLTTVPRISRLLAVALVCGVSLAACEIFEEPGNVVIVNNSSHQIIVTAGEETQVAFQGKSIEMPYPNPDAVSGGLIRIETTLCRLRYQVPLESDDYPWKQHASGELALQLETDFKLYAVPPVTRLPVRLTSVTQLQRGDFPVAPTEMHCGRSDEDR